MPEGPEVKLSADLILPLIVGKAIDTAQPATSGRYRHEKGEFSPALGPYLFNPAAPTHIEKVEVKGKFMYWTFQKADKSTFWMMNTFGMTGQWGPQKGKHPCFTFKFTDGSEIWFNDHRHFGTIKFTDDYQDVQSKINSLGWDPLQKSVSEGLEFVTSFLNKSKKPIAQVLMDQSVFAGVGNYIRAESLYAIKMSPWRVCVDIRADEIMQLCTAIKEVMETSYKYQGATISTYTDPYGAEGKYSSCFKVYGCKTDLNGHPIIKQETPDGRTIHWCPEIQK